MPFLCSLNKLIFFYYYLIVGEHWQKNSTEPGWMVGNEIYLMPSRWQIFPPRVGYLFAQRCWHARISDSYRSVWKMWFVRIWKQAAQLGEHSRPKAKGLPTAFKMLIVSLVVELEWNHLYQLQYLADSTDLHNQTQEIWRGEGEGGGAKRV